MKEILVLFAVAVIVTLLVGAWVVSWHERVHEQIFSSAGISSKVELIAFGLGGGKTIPDANYPDLQTAELSRLQHSVNESISYNLFPFLLVITFVLVMQLFMLLLILRNSGARK